MPQSPLLSASATPSIPITGSSIGSDPGTTGSPGSSDTVEAALTELYTLISAITSGPDVSLATVATSGSSQTIDVSVARTYDITLTADCTFSLTGAVTAEAWFVTVLRRQGSGAPWLETWPGSVTWIGGTAPTLGTTVGDEDIVTLFSVDGGTSWLGVPVGGGGTTSGRWELAVIPGSPPDPLYAAGDFLYILVP